MIFKFLSPCSSKLVFIKMIESLFDRIQLVTKWLIGYFSFAPTVFECCFRKKRYLVALDFFAKYLDCVLLSQNCTFLLKNWLIAYFKRTMKLLAYLLLLLSFVLSIWCGSSFFFLHLCCYHNLFILLCCYFWMITV